MLKPSSIDFSPSSKAPIQNSFLYHSQTINSNLAYGNSITFTFPKSPRYYDPSSVLLTIKCKVTAQDGGLVPTDAHPFLKTDGIGGLFERVSVALNGETISVENHFPFITHLFNTLSFDKQTRNTALGFVGNVGVFEFWSSDLSNISPDAFADKIEQAESGRVMTLRGSFSPFLSSAPLILPSFTEVSIRLDRASDRSVIGCFDPNQQPKLEVLSATLSMKGWDLTVPSISHIETTLKSGGLMPFNKYRAMVKSVPENSNSFSWMNVFGSQPLGETCYLTILKERAFLGNYQFLNTIYEHAFVRRISFLVNQVPILLGGEYRCNFDGSTSTRGPEDPYAATDSYYAFLDLLGIPEGKSNIIPFSYRAFLMGNVMHTARVPTGAGAHKNTDPFDIHIEFARPLTEPHVVILFTKDNAHVCVDSSRNYRVLP